jgi:hypothetical protein
MLLDPHLHTNQDSGQPNCGSMTIRIHNTECKVPELVKLIGKNKFLKPKDRKFLGKYT